MQIQWAQGLADDGEDDRWCETCILNTSETESFMLGIIIKMSNDTRLDCLTPRQRNHDIGNKDENEYWYNWKHTIKGPNYTVWPTDANEQWHVTWLPKAMGRK